MQQRRLKEKPPANTPDGSRVKVEKVHAAVDCGPVINLSGAKNQVEGAVIDALSTAHLEITFADGAARQSNFNDYELLRIGDDLGSSAVYAGRGAFKQ